MKTRKRKTVQGTVPEIPDHMNKTDRLFLDIKRILILDRRTIADLARDLNRNYQHVNDWMRRRFNPRAEAMIQLIEWRDRNIKGKSTAEVFALWSKK